MHLIVLLISIFALYLISIGTQAYGSTQGTNQCNLFVNQSCPQSSQAESKTESETSQAPLIFPDFSPTREDLNSAEADESVKAVDSDDNDGATVSASADSGDNDNIDDSDDEQEANDEDSNDGEGKDSGDGDGPSVIPFP